MTTQEAGIVSIGVINIDFVVDVGTEIVGGKHLGKSLSVTAGGHGSSLPIAVSRSGVPVTVLGQIGNDPFGQQICTTLKSEGVNCDYLEFSGENSTGVSIIMFNDDGNRTHIDFLGANLQVTTDYIDSCRSLIEHASLATVHIGPGTAMSAPAHRVIEIASDAGAPILATFSNSAALDDTLLENIDYLVLNMKQAASLSGLNGGSPRNARIAAGMLSSKVRGHVIIQMNEFGVLIEQDGIMTVLDSCPNEVAIDTAGMTDFFAGVFASEIYKGYGLTEAAIKAHKAAIKCMKKIGVYTSFPAKEELNNC